jgi:RND family efflux transporter MFP subunit
MSRIPLALMLLVAATTAHAQSRPAAVEVARAHVRVLSPEIEAVGTVQARAAADLAAGAAGRLEWVAEPGSLVNEGQPVARLETTELELARAEQAARVQREEVNLRSLDRELERMRLMGGAVSRAQFDQAESQRDLARADLALARAALAQTEERRARTTLLAPFSGVLAERLRRAGEEVNRGEIVVRVLDPENLEIRLFVPLQHLRVVRPGDSVEVRGERGAFEATVSAIVPAGDSASQSFEVLIGAPHIERLLAPGQTVRVKLPLGVPQEATAIPRDALIIRSGGIFVYRVNGEQRAERVDVKLGIADGDWIGVDEGLSPGDAVVVRGGESLRPDQDVKVVGVFEHETTRISVTVVADDGRS